MQRTAAPLSLLVLTLACSGSDDAGEPDDDDSGGTDGDSSDGDDGDDSPSDDGGESPDGGGPAGGSGPTLCTLTISGDEASGVAERTWDVPAYRVTETSTDLSTAAWVGDPTAPLRGSAVSCQHTENEAGQVTPSLVVSLSSGVLDGRLEELVPVELDETSNSAIDRAGMVAFYDPEDPSLNRTWLCGGPIGTFAISIETAVVVAETATNAAYAASGMALGQCIGSFGTPGAVMLTATWYPAP